jgi:flagellar hook-basal body complex protein FliE
VVQGLNGIGSVVVKPATAVAGLGVTETTAAGGGPPFSGIFQSLVAQTSALDAKASEAVTGLLNGQGVEIHDAMIATEKADMAFELALQVRNKAVGAYQQMMGMQF